MAVNFRDRWCGFRHREVVEFINEEIRSNGTDLYFYVAYSSESWSLVEDRLWAILCDPRVPRTFKRAYTWSALALSARMVSRQRVQQVRQVRRLQEQVSQGEAATRALASQLQQLREEREDIILQLRQTQDDLQKSLDEREVLRGQLLQAKRSAQFNPPPQEVDLGSQAQEQCATAWPQHAEEQGKVAAAGAKGRRDGEAQEKEAGAGGKGGNIYIPGSPSPWAQVVPPLLPMPHSQPFSYHPPFPIAFQCTLPPPPTAVIQEETAGEGLCQMPLGMICTPGVQAAAGRQKNMGPLWDQRSQGEEEGAVGSEEIDALFDNRSHGKQESTVRPKFRNSPGHSWSRGDSRNQPQEPKTWPPKAPGTLHNAEEARASRM